MSNTKTTKCLDIVAEGKHFVCTFTPSRRNPYQLYHKWYDRGWHQRKLVEYANFLSVIYWLEQYGNQNRWGFRDVFPEQTF